MPRKMKELLDGCGIRADKDSFGHADASGDRKYGGVAVKKGSGRGGRWGGEQEGGLVSA